MEELSSSSLKSAVSSEESTWTEYFVDFLLSEEEEKKRGEDASCYSHGADAEEEEEEEEEEEGSSMISDAASCAPGASPEKRRELRRLKKKVFRALEDDSLEDTASSPVNSPKVSALSQLQSSPTKNCNSRNLNKEGGVGDHHGGVACDDQRSRAYEELKEKGLCLFPLSMLLDYHG